MTTFKRPSESEQDYLRAITPTLFRHIITIWSCATFIMSVVAIILSLMFFIMHKGIFPDDLNVVAIGALVSLVLSIFLGAIFSPLSNAAIIDIHRGNFTVAHGIIKNNSIIIGNKKINDFTRIDKQAVYNNQAVLVCLCHDRYFVAVSPKLTATNMEYEDEED